MKYTRFRELREEQNLTKKQVAEIIGRCREVYRRYEDGTCEIPVICTLTLEKYYDVSVDYLVGITDVKK